MLILLLIGLAVPTKPILNKYLSIAEKVAAKQPLQSDAVYQVASYIKTHNPSGEPVYMMTDHIVYWLIGMQPITKSVTHPSTIGKDYLLKVFLGPEASTESELVTLFGKRPLYVVKTKSTWYLEDKAAKLLEDLLYTNYMIVETIDGRYVYKRIHP
jgi:hypothetical protein